MPKIHLDVESLKLETFDIPQASGKQAVGVTNNPCVCTICITCGTCAAACSEFC